jgi:hypothetical protein
MKIMKRLLVPIALAASIVSGASYAAEQNGLVNVKVGDIGVDGLNNTTVQVPVGIAAQVCGVDANVIAKQRDEAVTNCTVTKQTANQAFLNYVTKKSG